MNKQILCVKRIRNIGNNSHSLLNSHQEKWSVVNSHVQFINQSSIMLINKPKKSIYNMGI